MPVLDPNFIDADVEDITGAFSLRAVARFDDLLAGSWQRVFDFGDGPATNNVILTQYENTNDLMFAVYQDGAAYVTIAADALVEGEVAAFDVGVDADGLMWIEKDGVRLSEAQGVVPRAEVRANEYLGQSNWADDTDLNGAVLGVDVTNLGDTSGGGALNETGQISGAFQVDVAVRFDDVGALQDQQVFSAESADGAQSVQLAQVGSSSDLMFEFVQDGVSYTAVAQSAIIQGELSYWSVGVGEDGRMWIEKDGVRLAEATAVVPNEVPLDFAQVGAVPENGDALDGVIADLHLTGANVVDPVVTDPVVTDPVVTDPVVTDPVVTDPVATDPVPQIDGAFRLDATVRFDDVMGGQWQRVFDFGDGPSSNNILLGQVENTSDMVFEVWQDGMSYRVIAPDAIVQGETAVWSVGVEPDGTMWIGKDGAMLAEGAGVVPADVDRANLLIGESNWSGDDPLAGEVMGLDVLQGATYVGPDGLSAPQDGGGDPVVIDPVVTDPVVTDPVVTDPVPQIDGAFRLDATVRFDDVMGGQWQRVFDFGDGPSSNNILLGQVENTSDMVFEVWQDGMSYRVIAPDAIVQGETAVWSVGVEPDGTMWIGKDGALLAEGAGVVPADVDRANLLIGESNWSGDDPLAGEVVGLDVLQGATYVGPDGLSAPQDGGGDPVVTDPVVTDPVATDPAPDGSVIDPDGSGSPSTGTGDMVIVAHQDDDILFMNPTIGEAIDGDLPVTTVYLTAGDFGLDQDYWGAREAGEKDAYAHMAGSNDWVDETVHFEVGGSTFDVASSYLASQPDVRLYFLRLPDGFSGTGSELYDFESLAKLWDGRIDTATSVDDANSYTPDQLTGVLTAIMERHQPDQLHIQDHTSEHSGLEHSDHFHAAEFASVAAEDYTQGGTVISYHGYATWGFEENVEGDVLVEVQQTFDAYAQHDAQVWESDGTLIDAYVEWLQREYVADEYVLPAIDPAIVEQAAADLTAQEAEAAAQDPLLVI